MNILAKLVSNQASREQFENILKWFPNKCIELRSLAAIFLMDQNSFNNSGSVLNYF